MLGAKRPFDSMYVICGHVSQKTPCKIFYIDNMHNMSKMATINEKPKYAQQDILAAWDIYIDIVTAPRFKQENICQRHAAILDNVESFITRIRDTLKAHGPGCINTTHIGLSIIQDILVPFQTEWKYVKPETLGGLALMNLHTDTFEESVAHMYDMIAEKQKRLKTIALAGTVSTIGTE